MTNLFHKVNRIYAHAERAIFVPHQIHYPLFRDFSFRLQILIRELRDELEIADWKRFIRKLKRYRFEQLTAPLGFGNPTIVQECNIVELQEMLTRLRGSSPDLVSEAEEILRILDELISRNENPMLEKLLEIGKGAFRLPAVITESRLIKPTENVFAQAGFSDRLFVLSESQLRRNATFEEIACFGASRWYNDFVFSAPRAYKIHLLRFDWIRDRLSRNSSFINPVKSSARSEKENQSDEVSAPAENLLEPSDIIPSVSLTDISLKFAHRNREQLHTHSSRESVEARLFWLQGRRGVFLEENSRVLIIDLYRDPPVRKRLVSELSSGSFVLLRDKGNGDFIVPVADNILGRKAQKLRSFQYGWKRKLRELVKAHGLGPVISQLKEFDGIHANKTNLRNWMSDRNIETRDPKDFAAMMKLLGLEDSLETCIGIAKQIRQAHQKAGRLIQKMLVQKVSETDLAELEKYGEMKFELSSAGEKLVARRVVRRADQTVEIDARQLNRRFRLE